MKSKRMLAMSTLNAACNSTLLFDSIAKGGKSGDVTKDASAETCEMA